jgi:hypothetical protein
MDDSHLPAACRARSAMIRAHLLHAARRDAKVGSIDRAGLHASCAL